jgi:hypothetical protein
VALAKKARWECRLNSGGVATMPPSEFMQGDRLADLFYGNTNGRMPSPTSYETIFPRVYTTLFLFFLSFFYSLHLLR